MAGLISMCAVFVVVTIEMTFSTLNGEALGGCHGGHAQGIGGGGSSDRPGYTPIDNVRGEEMSGGAGVGGEGRSGHGRANGRANAVGDEEEEVNILDEIAQKKKGPRHKRTGSISGGLRNLERSVCACFDEGYIYA